MESLKTCLLIDARKLNAMCLDGPALRIGMQTQSCRLFPLRRIARIHIMGAPQVGLDALLHCAEQQIPVAFFTLRGKLRCQLYFPVFEKGVLGHWMDHIDFDAEAKKVYDEWLADHRLHILSRMGYRAGAREIRSEIIQQALAETCNQCLGKRRYRDAMDWLNGMLTAQLSQIIVEYGLSNQSRSKGRLLQDITPACELWVLYFLVAEVTTRPDLPVNAHTMSQLYQTLSERIDYTVRHMLTMLGSRLEAIV